MRGKAGGHTPPQTRTHTPLRLGAPARPGCCSRPSPVDQACLSQSPRSSQHGLQQRPISEGSGRGGGFRATARRARGGAVALSRRALRGLGAAPGCPRCPAELGRCRRGPEVRYGSIRRPVLSAARRRGGRPMLFGSGSCLCRDPRSLGYPGGSFHWEDALCVWFWRPVDIPPAP